MTLETDRGLLDRRDRQYLRDATDKQKRIKKGQIDSDRIRKEIYYGLLDFTLIAAELEEEDRQKLFEELPEDRELQRGIESALAFLYRGLNETGHDFDAILQAQKEDETED